MLNRTAADVQYSIGHNQINHFYQPLFQLEHRRLLGYEALIRCKISPERLFWVATRTKGLYQLDTASILAASVMFGSSDQAKSDTQLFLNVFPSTLLNPSFQSFIEETLLDSDGLRSRVVFELVEFEQISDFRAVRDVIRFLHSHEYRIAIDDVGKGAASLEKVLELDPDFIKLDRYFSSNISHSVNKQKIVSLFVGYCDEGTHLILEGIENIEDLTMAEQLGVHIGQGYFLGKPAPLPNTLDK
jgi:EAL domain-containing protein (putative c-di-GMP-specific phosphodiesterase class I)